MKPTLRAALDEARQALVALYGDRLVHVILYGSQARGDAREASDVDVLVVIRGPLEPVRELKRLAPLRLRLLSRYGEDLSIQPFEEAVYEDPDHPLMQAVRAEGVAL
ncbi:nucleotidyltransferase domain-containing protein [Rhodocaloribacter sp.]